MGQQLVTIKIKYLIEGRNYINSIINQANNIMSKHSDRLLDLNMDISDIEYNEILKYKADPSYFKDKRKIEQLNAAIKYIVASSNLEDLQKKAEPLKSALSNLKLEKDLDHLAEKIFTLSTSEEVMASIKKYKELLEKEVTINSETLSISMNYPVLEKIHQKVMNCE